MSTDRENDPFWKAVKFEPSESPDPCLAPVEERMAKLREHKDVLLSHLQDAYERGPKKKLLISSVQIPLRAFDLIDSSAPNSAKHPA